MAEATSIDIKKFLAQHFTFPSLPEVVNRLQNTIYDDNIDIDEISDLISGDPGLVAQVLKVVNSAYYGLPHEIGKVRIAIALLGLNEIFRMVLSISVINTLDIKDKKEIDKFWFHSFYTAICTKYLTKKFEPHLSIEELWSAAILHDIGKLVYLKFFPDLFKTLSKYSEEQGCTFSDAERHYKLPASSSFGNLLSDRWRLPNKVKLACRHHTMQDLKSIHESNSKNDFIRIICLGNLLTTLSTTELAKEIKLNMVKIVREILDYTEEEFLMLMGDIYELRIEVERFMENIR